MRQAADVPEPPMALSEAERERLREAMARAEEARRRLPEAQTSSAEAERELDQALSRLLWSRGRAAGRSKRCPQGRTRLPRWLRRFSIRKLSGKTASAGLRRLVPMRNVRGKRWRVCVSVGRHVPPVPPWTHSGRHCGVYVPPCPGWLWNMCALPMPNPLRRAGAASGTESSPALVVLGSVLAVLGVAGAVLRGVLEVAFLRLGSVALPLEGWLLGAFLLVGGAFVWAGFPRRKERRPEFAATAERLQQRRTACLRGAGRAREIGELCRDGRPFRCGRGNRGRFRARGGAGAGTVRRRGTSGGGDTAPRGVLRRSRTPCANGAGRFGAGIGGRAGGNGRWLAWFQTHGVDAPLPGEAAVFCARVDSARMRLASALAKRRELAGAGGGSRRLAGVRALFAFRGLLLRG